MRLYISVISFRLVLAVVRRALQKLHREMLGSNLPVVLVVVQITPFFFLPHMISCACTGYALGAELKLRDPVVRQGLGLCFLT
jgi:hypothetical protein